MIRFTLPWALAGAALLAGPVLVHMLVRRHARRVVFPTTRFLTSTRAAAIRVRRPSDLALMALRLAVVAAAVLAAAQPVLTASWRAGRLDRRVARAVVLDTSRSMAAAPTAEALAAQEMKADMAARFAGAALDSEIRRASEWLATTPPARREIVIVSDFQRGAVDEATVAAVPRRIGVRTIRAGKLPEFRSVALPLVSGWRDAAWRGSATLRNERLDTTWTRQGAASSTEWLSTSQPSNQSAAADRAVAAAVSFGVAAGDDSRRLVVAFANAPTGGDETELRTAWMLRAEVALRASKLLREAAAAVRSAERDGVMIVHTNIAADSPAAPVVVRAAILAVRPAEIADTESEIATIPDAVLAGWTRPPAPVSIGNERLVSDSIEARWLWAIALLLLAIENAIRGRRAAAASGEAHAHAA